MLIKNITINFGSKGTDDPLTYEPAPINILIGPNNSGKSLFLREMDRRLRENRPFAELSILANITFDESSFPEAKSFLENLKTYEYGGRHAHENHIYFPYTGENTQISTEGYNAWLINPTFNDPHGVYRIYLKYATVKLDGPNRIGLVADKQLGDLQAEPKNRLEQLFQDLDSRTELRKVIFDAIGAYFVLDPTKPGHVRIRLSKSEPSSIMEEQGIHPEAVQFHAKALLVSEASDGIKAFCGILIELYAGDPKVLLIDEPEAFLHPTLATGLAKAIANKAGSTGKQLFIATHSSNFLWGCIQSGVPLNIIRQTYNDNVATARLLKSAELSPLMRDPMLRSVGVLEGLFYNGVIVTEGDSDRAFYAEINERLLDYSNGRGAKNTLFLNAQNKQTIRRIISLLRNVGIPAAGIVDIDVVKEGGRVWTDTLRSVGVPEPLIEALSTLRTSTKVALEATGKDMKTEGGMSLLTSDNLRSAIELFDILDEYGLFVVRGGEVESWLKELGVQGKSGWLTSIFERMGSVPSDANYIKPSEHDVWQFVDTIATWISKPDRKGLH